MEQDIYKMPKHGWTCFHCGETFTTVGAAREHFGVDPSYEPGCLIDFQVQVEEGGKPERGRGLLIALRAEQARNEHLRMQNEELDHQAGRAAAMDLEIKRYFGEDVTSLWLAADRYRSKCNEVEALEMKLRGEVIP